MLNYCVQREEPGNEATMPKMNIWGSVIVSTLLSHCWGILTKKKIQNVFFFQFIYTQSKTQG